MPREGSITVSPNDLRPLRTAAPDHAETERLKRQLRALRAGRDPFFLTGPELHEVFLWKLGSQFGRVADHFRDWTDPAYCVATQACFSYSQPDAWGYELEIRVRLLMALPGVGLGIASAVLALAEPPRYCVIDFRGWRAVFGELRRSFTITHYIMYLERVKSLAKALAWDPQETDLALWEYDRRLHGRAA